MSEFTHEYDLQRDGGKNYSVRIDGKNIVCSQHIFDNLIILRFRKPVNSETMEKMQDILGAAEDFSRRLILLVPDYVEVVKPVPSTIGQITKQCPQCQGIMRTLGKDEMVCLSCGYNSKQKLKHLSRVLSLTEGIEPL